MLEIDERPVRPEPVTEIIPAHDIARPGGRLPTQRVLARQLGVTLTTVTRAYVEAQRRGLLNGEVGRGTFVRPSAMEIEGPEQGVLDLAVNALMPLPYMEELSRC